MSAGQQGQIGIYWIYSAPMAAVARVTPMPRDEGRGERARMSRE
jgi:hypothetical protein